MTHPNRSVSMERSRMTRKNVRAARRQITLGKFHLYPFRRVSKVQRHAPDEADGSDRDRDQPDQIRGTWITRRPAMAGRKQRTGPGACTISEGACNEPHPS